MPTMQTSSRSWGDIKYPSLRNVGVGPDAWLKAKQADDGAENLWRIYDTLYDFTDFAKHHPGGSMWLQITKGTDITEAFESHHLTTISEKLLPRFQIKNATTPRNSPFTFHPNGFYKTLKRKVFNHFDGKPPPVSVISRLLLDLYVTIAFITCIMAAKYQSFSIATISAVFFGFVTSCGHNLVHMKDSWRIHYYNFTLFNAREWRIVHCLSHHQYTNTLLDYEITFLEPYLEFLPKEKKMWFVRFGSWIYLPYLTILIFFVVIWTRIKSFSDWQDGQHLLFTVPLAMLLFGKCTLYTILLWGCIACISCTIVIYIGIVAGHHTLNAFHEGDTPREDRDWGLHSIDSTNSRYDISGLDIIGLTFFGEHTLHHLFPAIDHVYLKELLPIYHETLEEFGIQAMEVSTVSSIGETYLQLIRNKPNNIIRKFIGKGKDEKN